MVARRNQSMISWCSLAKSSYTAGKHDRGFRPKISDPRHPRLLGIRRATHLCANSGREQVQQAAHSLNHLVGAQQKRLRDREAKRRLQIDHQLELGRLLYWQIGGFGTLENLIHEICCSAPKRGWSP